MKVIEADVKYLSNLLRYMHQSIFQLCGPPQTPPPPPAPLRDCRVFTHLFSPGGGAFANFDYD